MWHLVLFLAVGVVVVTCLSWIAGERGCRIRRSTRQILRTYDLQLLQMLLRRHRSHGRSPCPHDGFVRLRGGNRHIALRRMRPMRGCLSVRCHYRQRNGARRQTCLSRLRRLYQPVPPPSAISSARPEQRRPAGCSAPRIHIRLARIIHRDAVHPFRDTDLTNLWIAVR